MKEAAVGPPGVMPIQTPMALPRNMARKYRGIRVAARRISTGLSLARTLLNSSPSSSVSSSSPIPKRPITTTRKEMPLISAGISKFRRMEPETVSMPTMPKPRQMETSVLSGAPPPKAMKEAKASR